MLSRRELLIGGLALTIPKWLVEDFAGRKVFDGLMALAKKRGWAALSLPKCTAAAAQALIGTPYVGWTLERSADIESPFVTLEGLDCVTLFESSLGFARMLAHGGQSPEDLVKEVALTRYRGGRVDGYLSRLHYTSDWMLDNAKKGVVELPRLSGAERLTNPIHFMSSHPNTYRQLKAHPEWLPSLKEMEETLTSTEKWFVPKRKLVEGELRTGDIVGLTTSMDGMDIPHTGLIVVEGHRARFLNASSVAKKVVLDGSVCHVLATQKSLTGIMVARPL